MVDNIDFFNVQFYNNPSCNLNSGEGFMASLSAWSDDIDSAFANGRFNRINNGIEKPRLMIGVPAWEGAGSGYADTTSFKTIMQQVKSMCSTNCAGVMYWDGAYEVQSGGNGGQTFAEIVREVFR